MRILQTQPLPSRRLPPEATRGPQTLAPLPFLSVAPRPRNYAERLFNPQAMLRNRRAWDYRSHATLRSCHKHWHSYQSIIERSRLVEQAGTLHDSTTQNI